MEARESITLLLQKGDRSALEQLSPLVYAELRKLAGSYMRKAPPGQTLQPTALVHEAYLKLVDQTQIRWENRGHFFGIAAQAMRHILVDHARSHNAAKRGGGAVRVELDESIAALPGREADLVALDDALRELARIDPRKSQLIELRFFGGLSVEETADVMGVSVATIGREMRLARAWLQREITRGGASAEPS
jgi:RNA polymerase sigma factor (TIGR02999 family)